MNVWDEWLGDALTGLDDANRRRRLIAGEPESATRVRRGGRLLTVFCSNDYLGLAWHPEVRRAAADAIAEYGMGPRAAALVCGYTMLHEHLEQRLAAMAGSEAALLFPTGFAANTALLSSIGGDDVDVFSDLLNHASIIDGCRLAARNGARVTQYRHGDLDHLERRLKASKARRRLIITETVFSMDGDLAPLAGIVELKHKYDAMLVTDEAHATLVFGERGAGLAEHLGIEGKIDLRVGTLSKAFGCQGGFVACSKHWRDWLLNRGRAFVFSTALPMPVVASAVAALEVRNTERPQKVLWDNLALLGQRLGRQLEAPIVPIVIGDEAAALRASEMLSGAGFFVPAIRPPTVPRGTSRLRVTLSSAHTAGEVEALADALTELGSQLPK